MGNKAMTCQRYGYSILVLFNEFKAGSHDENAHCTENDEQNRHNDVPALCTPNSVNAEGGMPPSAATARAAHVSMVMDDASVPSRVGRAREEESSMKHPRV